MNCDQKEFEKIDSLKERLTILSIAYHNLAVEFEYLKNTKESLATYEKAFKFAQNLGVKSDVAKNL